MNQIMIVLMLIKMSHIMELASIMWHLMFW